MAVFALSLSFGSLLFKALFEAAFLGALEREGKEISLHCMHTPVQTYVASLITAIAANFGRLVGITNVDLRAQSRPVKCLRRKKRSDNATNKLHIMND